MPLNIGDNQLVLTREDFDSLYRGKPVDDVTLGYVPWDIGAPQPCVVHWHESGRVAGPVLDAGCGTGHNSIYLAEQGLRVTGFDFASSAVERARTVTATHGLPPGNPEFAVADATALAMEKRYATVIDSALYHCLTKEQRVTYLRGLHSVTLPSARLLLSCAADTAPPGTPGPTRISRTELENDLQATGWTVEEIVQDLGETAFKPQHLQELARLLDTADFDPSHLTVNEQGHVLFPVWLVTAHATAAHH